MLEIPFAKLSKSVEKHAKNENVTDFCLMACGRRFLVYPWHFLQQVCYHFVKSMCKNRSINRVTNNKTTPNKFNKSLQK